MTIVRSITESIRIDEALPTPLSKALKVGSNKSTFQSAATKLRATLDDNTLSQVEKISNRDKRLKDKNYAIFFIMGDQLAIYQGGKDLGYGYTDSWSWSDLINNSDYIYALYLPDARDDSKLKSRDSYNKYLKNQRNTSSIDDIKRKYGIKNLDKLFISNGDGTYKIDTSIFDKIEGYLESESTKVVREIQSKYSNLELCLVFTSRSSIDDGNIRNKLYSIYKKYDDLDQLRSNIKMVSRNGTVTDDTIDYLEDYVPNIKILYLLDLIK